MRRPCMPCWRATWPGSCVCRPDALRRLRLSGHAFWGTMRLQLGGRRAGGAGSAWGTRFTGCHAAARNARQWGGHCAAAG